ncbi:MAG TPA: DinB family protein [Bryobacteraceae bacterium]|nr:DinB family protein [Bryobacteraceae bacterium]
MSPNVHVARPETARIAGQLQNMYQGPAWHGPALKPLLADVSGQQAAARPIQNAHSIWELVLHTTAWLRIASERLSASETRDHTPEENWPAVTGSWPDALAALEREQYDLERAILAFPDERLDAPAPASEPQTFYVLLHGVIQHIAYHAGQIALLKKA